MPIKKYQKNIVLDHYYEVRLASPSGLGEALKPIISTVGTAPLLTLYGAQNTPTGVTKANIATKMFLIADDVSSYEFDSIPNYLGVVLKSGTPTSSVISSINLETDLGVLA